MAGKKSVKIRPERKAGKRDGKSAKPGMAGEPLENAADDRRVFTSGFPLPDESAEDVVKRLFEQADHTNDRLLSLFSMEGGAETAWRGMAEIAMREIVEVSSLIVDRFLQLASTNPSSMSGRLAGQYLAELLARLLAASPVRKFELNETTAGVLSINPVFMETLHSLKGIGVGKKDVELRGADAGRFVLNELSNEEEMIREVLIKAEKQIRKRNPDVEGIARMVFSDLLASMLKSRWPSACMEFPEMARAAQGAANRKGMKSSFSAKSDNLRNAWLSIAAGEQGLSRLIA